jgi:hypothetical protein
MPALSEYTNVYNTALVILQKKGYQLWYEEATESYGAEKDGWDFKAWNPCALLGLVAIHDWKQPTRCDEYWWREREPDLYGKLPPTPPRPYTPVYQKERGSAG